MMVEDWKTSDWTLILSFSLRLSIYLQAPMYYRKANAAMLIYDMTSADSFYDIKDWVSGKYGCHVDLWITVR